MGRGRKGTIDQSAKKPKISKNKIRGGNYGVIPRPRNNKQNYPLLLTEDVIADMKKMRPQDLMNILLPNNVNRGISSQFTNKRSPVISAENTVSVSNKCQLTEYIQKLPPEIREIIYKEYVKIKLRERKALGWDEVNAAIKEAPLCDHNQQIVKVLFCYKCSDCRRNGLCNLCQRNRVRHYLGYPVYDEDDYDEVFMKYYNTCWFGAVAWHFSQKDRKPIFF